jgi:metallophosphoesterase superfamily enzyme
MVMPAFGAYAGGLNVRHPAFADVFGTRDFTAHVVGASRLYALRASRCVCD